MEDERIKKIVNESKTINEVLTKLGRNTSSAGYTAFKKYIIKNNIDISHFWTKREVISNLIKDGKIKKFNLDEIFNKNSLVSRHIVKKRIISEKLIKYECIICNNDGNWLGKKITLILDHINGVNNDNRIENLRFLCPNCNSTLVTHCKGHKGYELKNKKENKKKINKSYTPRVNKRKVERPDIKVLEKQIKTYGYVKTGKIYGVSDNSIRKWLKWSNKSLS